MSKYVALLRGITPTNPNMRNEKLRSVFEGLGLANVKTVISSGNVLFESPRTNALALETMIEKALSAHLGFKSTTIVRNQTQLQQLVDNHPFGQSEHAQKTYLMITFLKHKPGTAITLPYRPVGRPYEVLSMHDRALCSKVDLTATRGAQLLPWIERQWGPDITTRTWKTVSRILKSMNS